MALTGLPNFQMQYSGPWRGITKVQSWASSHSGSAFTTEADALAFLQSFWLVVSAFMAADIVSSESVWVSKWSYYNGTTRAALWEAEYVTSADAVAAGFTYANAGDALNLGDDPAPPEVCILLEAPIGLSATGKPVSIKKYIHWTQGLGPAPSYDTSGTGALAYALKLGNGDLYGSRVLTSPHGAQGTWVPYDYFSNHQMMRRRKAAASSSKATKTSAGGLLDSILAGAGGSALVEALLEAITL
jgi:hypothetical protein